MAVTFQTYNAFMGNLGNGNIDLDSDTFKAALTNAAPTPATDDELADVTQIANGFGYVTGGVALTAITWTEVTPGVWEFTSADFEWEAAGGSVGPFRYVPIYSDTSTGDKLVGWFDFGSALTIPDGSFFRVEIGANGIIRWGIGTIS